MDLFNELSEAVRSGNVEEIEKLKRKILLVGRDESLDKNFINSIKGKTLYKNLNRFIHNQDIDNYECAKMITSLITHLIIESMVRGSDIRNYPLSDLYIVLGEFICIFLFVKSTVFKLFSPCFDLVSFSSILIIIFNYLLFCFSDASS